MWRGQLEKSSFEALTDVIRGLQTHQVPYMLVNAFSSNAYGYPRATKEADIVIEYEEGVLKKSASPWVVTLSSIHKPVSNS